uniref:DNA replication licensing factor MCM7 n=1 Tax=Rhabditophanes sp. KR3021 TaxID=114890 RepID=A0AC35TMB5_9BILA
MIKGHWGQNYEGNNPWSTHKSDNDSASSAVLKKSQPIAINNMISSQSIDHSGLMNKIIDNILCSSPAGNYSSSVLPHAPVETFPTNPDFAIKKPKLERFQTIESESSLFATPGISPCDTPNFGAFGMNNDLMYKKANQNCPQMMSAQYNNYCYGNNNNGFINQNIFSHNGHDLNGWGFNHQFSNQMPLLPHPEEERVREAMNMYSASTMIGINNHPYNSYQSMMNMAAQFENMLGDNGYNDRETHHNVSHHGKKLFESNSHHQHSHQQPVNKQSPVKETPYNNVAHSKNIAQSGVKNCNPANISINNTMSSNFSSGRRNTRNEHHRHDVNRYDNNDKREFGSLLDDFRNNRNLEIEVVTLGKQIIDFAQDQYGSRYIQQWLENANDKEKSIVFEQIVMQAKELATSVFGNYIIQKFFQYGTQDQRTRLIAVIKGNVIELASALYGCRVIQKAFETVPLTDRLELLHEMKNSIIPLIVGQNSNHVIQKVIEKVPPTELQFIIDAIFQEGDETVTSLSCQPYGCRVIQRILEYCTPEQKRPILEEIHKHIQRNICNEYANYVVQHVLVHGEKEDIGRIVEEVKNNLLEYSQHKFASNVIEKCLDTNGNYYKNSIINAVCADKTNMIETLLRHEFGNFVIQKMLDVADNSHLKKLMNCIKPHISSLRKANYGKHIIDTIMSGIPSIPAEIESIKTTIATLYFEDSKGGKNFALNDQVTNCARRESCVVFVELDHIMSQSPELAEKIMKNPVRYEKLFMLAIDAIIKEQQENGLPVVKDALDAYLLQRIKMLQESESAHQKENEAPRDHNRKFPPELLRRYEICLRSLSGDGPLPVRDVKAKHIGKLITVIGIVISVTEVCPHAQVITYSCDTCGCETFQTVTGESYVPAVECPSKECVESRASGRLTMQVRGSKFIKFQKIRIQETSGQVPVGCIPRAMTINGHRGSCVSANAKYLNHNFWFI